ncbi:MAG: DNA polymerase III subunit beta [Candidatus Paceibacterota bacterium]
MKLEILKDALANAIYKSEKIAVKNATLPVLSCVLITASKNAVKIRTTNLDIGLEISIPAKVEVEGAIAVPANILNSFLNGLGNEKSIILEADENKLSVLTSHVSTSINLLNHNDYPTIPIISEGESFLINSSDFTKGVKAVYYSSAVSSMKPELASVFIYTDGDWIYFVATDSFRLAEKKIKAGKRKEFSPLLIPFKNTIEIARIFENVNGEIKVIVGKNQISIFYENFYITSRVVDGNFPDYKQFFPKDFLTEVVVLKQDIIDIFKLSNIFSDNFNRIRFEINPSRKTFEIITKNTSIGENTSKVDAVLKGESVDLSFNYKYIADSFQSIDSDSIGFYFNGPNKPAIMKGISDNSFNYMVMPMNR